MPIKYKDQYQSVKENKEVWFVETVKYDYDNVPPTSQLVLLNFHPKHEQKAVIDFLCVLLLFDHRHIFGIRERFE